MRTILKLSRILWTSSFFESLTFRLGAYLLLLTNIVLPFGQHRLWMKIGGWWYFPGAFCLAGIGTWGYFRSGIEVLKIFLVPYVLLFIFDSLLLSIAPVPLTLRERER